MCLPYFSDEVLLRRFFLLLKITHVTKGVAREIDSWNLDLTQFIGETKIGPVSTFFRSIRSSDKESCEVFIRNISIDVTLHKTRSYSVDRQEH